MLESNCPFVLTTHLLAECHSLVFCDRPFPSSPDLVFGRGVKLHIARTRISRQARPPRICLPGFVTRQPAKTLNNLVLIWRRYTTSMEEHGLSRTTAAMTIHHVPVPQSCGVAKGTRTLHTVSATPEVVHRFADFITCQ
jgi:hypothetical protein